MRKITFLIFFSLISICSFAQLPDAPENFEGAFPPTGWNIYDNDSGSLEFWELTPGGTDNPFFPAYEGTYAAMVDREDVPDTDPVPQDWLVTPLITLPTNPQLRFFSRLGINGDDGGLYRIMVSTDADPSNLSAYTEIVEWTELEINPVQQVYTEKAVSLTGLGGQSVYIAFVMEGDYADRWMVDAVQLVEECIAPTELTASNIATDSAELNWTQPAGVTSWEIEVVELGMITTGEGELYSGSLPYLADGLQPGTDYRYFVRSVCGTDNESLWAGPFEFTTLSFGDSCAAPIEIPNLPYTTLDNTSNYGNDYSGSPGASGCGTTLGYLNGDDVVYSYTAAADDIISITMTENAGFSGMFVYEDCADIGVNCVAGGVCFGAAPVVISDFAVTAGQTYYIVISTWAPPQTTSYRLTVQESNCTPPSNLSANNIDFDSADLSWAANGASSWEIVIQNAGSGIPQGTGTTVTTNTNYNATATTAGAVFTEATAYEFYVRSDCEDGSFSGWAGPFSFSTTQIPVTLPYLYNFDNPLINEFSISNGTQTNKWIVGNAVSNSPNYSLYITDDDGLNNNYNNTSASIVHAYRDIQFPATTPLGTISVSFDIKVGGQNISDYVRVWLVPTSYVPTPGTSISNFNSGGVLLSENLSLLSEWTTQNIVIDSDTYANTAQRLIFEWRNDGSNGVAPGAAIDNINIKAETCAAPTALTLTDATQSSVILSWTAPDPAPSNYDYYYSQSAASPVAGTTPSGTVASTTATIGSLTPSTTYYFWVRSNCGSGNTSFWQGPFAVVVPQVPAVLEYTQNFDSGASNFNILNGTQINKWYVGDFVSNSPSNALYISNDNGLNNNYTNNIASVVHAYRDIQIPSGALEVNIAFDIKVNGDAGGDYVRVWMVPVTFIPTPGSQITASPERVQVTPDLYGITSWTTLDYDFPTTDYQNASRRLVFEWRNNSYIGGPVAAAIDNINVKVNDCPKPADLSVIDLTNTNATLDWVEPGSATEWEIAIMPLTDAAEPENPGTLVTDDSQFTPADGTLEYGIQYVFYVRSICGGSAGNSNWSGPFQFALSPVNDICDQATNVEPNTDLNCENFVIGNLSGSTATAGLNGCGAVTRDVWYTFTASSDTHIINIDNIAGDPTNIKYAVYSGSCGALTQILCADIYGFYTVDNLVEGETYWIQVSTYTDTAHPSTSFQLCITTPPPPPANDSCSTAEELPVNATLNCDEFLSGTLFSATASPEPSTCYGDTDDDVWYTFTATSSIHRINLFNLVGNIYQFTYTVYQGSDCGSLTEVFCSDNNENWVDNLIAGETYYVRVYTYTTGNFPWSFDICVSTPTPTPVNDDCAGAITVPVNASTICEETVQGTVQSATASPESNDCVSSNNDDDDVWFEFTATNNAHIIELSDIIALYGGSSDLYHVVYSGDQCGNLTQLYCSDANLSLANNLTIGELYKIRVYTNSSSLNQTATFNLCVSTPPAPALNDECEDATLVTVNPTSYCETENLAYGTIYGATASVQANTCSNTNNNDDVWFEFTATESTQIIQLRDIIGTTYDLYFAVYSGDQCDSLSQLYCSDGNSSFYEDYVVGETYKIRVWSAATTSQTTTFNVCIRPVNTPIITDATTYTAEELVTDILVDSDCALVSNVSVTSQATFGGEQSIGYFSANNSGFPFNDGVVLATGGISGIPAGGFSNGDLLISQWPGDDDLHDIIVANNPSQSDELYHATILEFDFIPLTNTFTFEFLFASDEYGYFQCGFTDAFAFILTDQDGNSSNLAVVPGTNIPVSVTTIKEEEYNTECISQYPEYFDQYNFDMPIGAAINLRGQTVPMIATATVIPDTQYHIKLVIADYRDGGFNSAVFLGGGTFDIGSLELGEDLLVADGTALCNGESTIIDTGLNPDNYNFVWYNNGEVIPDATGASYTVTAPGDYAVSAQYESISCSYEGVVKVEFYPTVEDITGDPQDLIVCDATGFSVFDLTSNLDSILEGSDNPDDFTNTIHLTEEDAQSGDNPIDAGQLSSYTNITENLQTLWIRTVSASTTCVGIKSFNLIVEDHTPDYTISGNDGELQFCAETSTTIEVVITDDDPNPVTFTWTKDDIPLEETTASITVDEEGVYTVVMDRSGCSVSATVNVSVIPLPIADSPEDVTVCDSYILPALNQGNYFTGPEGTGTPYFEGDIIQATQELYVYAESGTSPNCFTQNVFTVNIIPSPVFSLGGPYTSCIASDIEINVTDANFDYDSATYSWTFNGESIVGDNTIIVSEFGLYELTVSVNGCTNTESVMVSQSTDDVSFIISHGCENNSYLVSVEDDNGSFNTDAASYLWEGPNGFTTDEREFVAPVAGEYFVRVTTEQGCVGEDFVLISDTGCNIQKGISPNGDGLNDNFDLSNLDVRKLSIFNRYGKEVYSRDNYIDEWYGQTDNGKELPTGTYYYAIERRNGEANTGWIYINRQD